MTGNFGRNYEDPPPGPPIDPWVWAISLAAGLMLAWLFSRWL